MANAIPVIGWLLSLGVSISTAVPFWLCWTVFGIGEKYFAFLPVVYHSLPFWDCVWLAIVLSTAKEFLLPKMFCSCSTDK